MCHPLQQVNVITESFEECQLISIYIQKTGFFLFVMLTHVDFYTVWIDTFGYGKFFVMSTWTLVCILTFSLTFDLLL